MERKGFRALDKEPNVFLDSEVGAVNDLRPVEYNYTDGRATCGFCEKPILWANRNDGNSGDWFHMNRQMLCGELDDTEQTAYPKETHPPEDLE